MSSYPPNIYHNGAGVGPGDPRRSQQINEMVSTFTSIKPLGGDRSVFEMPLQMRDGGIIKLRISIPVQYPDVPPSFGVSHALTHPWIDVSNLRLTCPMITNWQTYFRLVDAVREAQDGLLGLRPLTGVSQVYQNPQPIGQTQVFQNPSPTGQSQVFQNPSPTGQSQVFQNPSSSAGQTQVYQNPPLPDADPQNFVARHLQQFSTEELYQCLTQIYKYEELIESLKPEVKALQLVKDMKVQNIRLAEENLEGKSRIDERQNQITIIRSSELEDTRRFYETKLEEYQGMMTGTVDLGKLLHTLQTEATHLDKSSEQMIESVKEGQLVVDDFLESYFQSRKDFHRKELLAKSAFKLLS